MKTSPKSIFIPAAILLSLAITGYAAKEYKSGINWPEPKVVDPGPIGGPPSDAKVLFDGTNLDQFQGGEKWEIKDGFAIAKGGGITSKESFGDCQLHIEWATPAEVKGSGQGRGNSGVYLMGKYEVQILDSYENKTYFDGQAGAIYKQYPPMVNACRPPGEWQSYDIIFTSPRFNSEGKVTRKAYVTVLHNGVLIHNHSELLGGTSYLKAPSYKKHAEKLPFNIQFHGNPVRFRNIWIRKIHPQTPVPDKTKVDAGKKPEAKPKKGKQSKPKSGTGTPKVSEPKSDNKPGKKKD